VDSDFVGSYTGDWGGYWSASILGVLNIIITFKKLKIDIKKAVNLNNKFYCFLQKLNHKKLYKFIKCSILLKTIIIFIFSIFFYWFLYQNFIGVFLILCFMGHFLLILNISADSDNKMGDFGCDCFRKYFWGRRGLGQRRPILVYSLQLMITSYIEIFKQLKALWKQKYKNKKIKNLYECMNTKKCSEFLRKLYVWNIHEIVFKFMKLMLLLSNIMKFSRFKKSKGIFR
jgi:hypothetical protein